METFELLVLGSGAAGFAAAVAAKEQGISVAVLSRGVGATAVSSGAFDFGRPSTKAAPTDFASRTQHPDWKNAYSKILANPGSTPSPVDVQRVFMGFERALGLPLKMCWDKALVLPVSNGHWKQVHIAQSVQAGVELGALADKRLAFAFHPSWRIMAKALCRQWEQNAETNFETRVKVEAVELSDLPAMPDAPLPVVAVRLQRDAEFREKFVKSVAKMAESFDGVLLPPLFLDMKPLENLQQELQKPVSECLGTVEAVPGKRLQDAIFAALKRMGIPCFTAEHIRAERADGKIVGVEYWNGGDKEPRKLKSHRYVLASGKYFGGGVELQYEDLAEPLFGLPLASLVRKRAWVGGRSYRGRTGGFLSPKLGRSWECG
ncbi:MAG: FAD-binding protein [Bdellovibrionota bacterium]